MKAERKDEYACESDPLNRRIEVEASSAHPRRSALARTHSLTRLSRVCGETHLNRSLNLEGGHASIDRCIIRPRQRAPIPRRPFASANARHDRRFTAASAAASGIQCATMQAARCERVHRCDRGRSRIVPRASAVTARRCRVRCNRVGCSAVLQPCKYETMRALELPIASVAACERATHALIVSLLRVASARADSRAPPFRDSARLDSHHSFYAPR
jgi:hypothetical protein